MNAYGTVHLVGAGPGDPDLLTVKALRLICEATTIVFDRLVSAEVMALTAPDARRIDVGKESGRHNVPQDRINEILAALARAGHDVVRLKGGDPLTFGRGGEEAAHLSRQGIRCEIVPGITAATACAAAAGIPLTHRGVAESVRLVTGHRKNDQELDLDFAALADPRCTLVVYMGLGNVKRMAEGLMDAGRARETPVAVVERGTTPRQRVLRGSLITLADDIARWRVEPPALLMIGDVAALNLFDGNG